jgi:chemotaxis protein MotB
VSRNKRPIVVNEGLAGWVMTYGDMMSLLLTFFVLIVSFSSIQDVKFKQAAMGLRDAFGILSMPESVLEMNQPLVPRLDAEQEVELLEEVQELERSLLAEGRDDEVTVEVSAAGITFRIAAPVLFSSAAARLQKDGDGVLARLAAVLRKYPYEVEVEGHTDSLPIHTVEFPSNWHLSAARAVAVARRLQELGVAPERLGATGYGEYRPLADNATAEGRARNRRVEIFIERNPDREVGGSLPLLDLERATERVRVEPPRGGPVTERLGQLRDD